MTILVSRLVLSTLSCVLAAAPSFAANSKASSDMVGKSSALAQAPDLRGPISGQAAQTTPSTVDSSLTAPGSTTVIQSGNAPKLTPHGNDFLNPTGPQPVQSGTPGSAPLLPNGTQMVTPGSAVAPQLQEPPRVGPSEQSTGADAATSLKGLANVTSVTASARALPSAPFTRMRDTDLQFVQVVLRNNSQQVAVVNGDATQASLASGLTPTVGGRYLVNNSKPGLRKNQIAALTAVTLGSAALAGPIFYEHITPDQHRRRSLGVAIGSDGTRHQVEGDRFGVRVLMPGDETVGWMAFACPAGDSVRTVTVPLSFSRSLTPDGILEVPVQASATGAMAPQNTAENQQAAARALKEAQKEADESGAPKKGQGMDGLMQD